MLNLEASLYAGPIFEDMTDNEMMDVEGEITPTVVITAITKVTASALVSAAGTFSLDLVFGD